MVRRWLAGTAFAVALALPGPAGAQPVQVDGEPDEWSETPIAHDVTGDSRGPTGSDVLSVNVKEGRNELYVLLSVAGGPNVNPSVITYTVDFSLGADFYNKRLVVWGDGNDLTGAIFYAWESRTAAAEAHPSEGAKAAAGSMVEFQIPFALLGGRFDETVWMKVSACDHVTGYPIDELQFQYRPSRTESASGGTSAAPPAASPAIVPQQPRIKLDGSRDDWEETDALVADDPTDCVGPAGTEIVTVGVCEDATDLYAMIELRDRPSVSGLVEYELQAGFGTEGVRVAFSGDGNRLSRSRVTGPLSAHAALEAAAGNVVELRIPFALLGGRQPGSRWYRIAARDGKTGRTYDTVEVVRVVEALPGDLAEARPPWAAPRRIRVPADAAAGQFSEFACADGSRSRWAVVGLEGDLLWVENRTVRDGCIVVYRFLADREGRVQRAWSGAPGGEGNPARFADVDPVAGRESVIEEVEEAAVVPAGRFASVRVTYVDARGATRTGWFSPEVRYPLALSPGAPAVGGVRLVDESGRIVWELAGNGLDARAELRAR